MLTVLCAVAEWCEGTVMLVYDDCTLASAGAGLVRGKMRSYDANQARQVEEKLWRSSWLFGSDERWVL